MSGPAAFLADLRVRVPELEPAYLEHMRDYDEMLPHVFMGDITRFAVEAHSRAVSGSKTAADTLERLLDGLEQGMRSSNEEIHELIAASFLENLDPENPHFDDLKTRLGPALQASLDLE